MRASCLGCGEKLALIPAFSPRRRRIIGRWFETANDDSRFLVTVHS
jgi:hypothetical protein